MNRWYLWLTGHRVCRYCGERVLARAEHEGSCPFDDVPAFLR